MRVSHKVDYGIRVMTALAVEGERHPGRPVTSSSLADGGEIPRGFLDDILRILRNGDLAQSRRGSDGGWSLARPAAQITVGEVIRVLEGPLVSMRGVRPHELAGPDDHDVIVELWVSARAALRSVLDVVTIDHLAQGRLPRDVARLLREPGAWDAR